MLSAFRIKWKSISPAIGNPNLEINQVLTSGQEIPTLVDFLGRTLFGRAHLQEQNEIVRNGVRLLSMTKNPRTFGRAITRHHVGEKKTGPCHKRGHELATLPRGSRDSETSHDPWETAMQLTFICRSRKSLLAFGCPICSDLPACRTGMLVWPEDIGSLHTRAHFSRSGLRAVLQRREMKITAKPNCQSVEKARCPRRLDDFLPTG